MPVTDLSTTLNVLRWQQFATVAERFSASSTTGLKVSAALTDGTGTPLTGDVVIGVKPVGSNLIEEIGVPTSGIINSGLTYGDSGAELTRGLKPDTIDPTDGDASFAQILPKGSKIYVSVGSVILGQLWSAARGDIGSTIKLNSRPTFLGVGSGADRVFADTTARDAALTSPAEGDKCRITGTGVQTYNGASWDTLGVATPVTASLGCEKVGNDIRLDIAASNDIQKLTGNEIDTNLVADKTEIDQLSGTTNIAEADTFFGATDISGAEAETLTDGSNANALHVHTAVFVVGDVLLNNADALQTKQNLGTLTKVKEVSIGAAGTLRIKFDLKIANAGGLARGQIHKNGSPEGTLQTTNSTGYVTFSEDIAGLAANDLIQLFIDDNSTNFLASTINFRFYNEGHVGANTITD